MVRKTGADNQRQKTVDSIYGAGFAGFWGVCRGITLYNAAKKITSS